jgi:hypothetical protein
LPGGFIMGKEYKKRLKEQYGRAAVVAYETVELGATILPPASGPTALADRQSIATYRVARPAKLDGVTIQLDAALAAGSGDVSVRVLKNGVAVGSGTVLAGLAHADVMFETELDDEVRLVVDDMIVVDMTKGATAAVHSLTARAALRLFEL